MIRMVLCLWLVLFLYPGGARAQVYSDRKVRNYRVTDKSVVEIQNKYGKVHVITWDKDSVRFEADLRISTNNYQKMDKLRSSINFEFTATKYYVVAKTTFMNKSGVVSDLVDAFIPSNQVVINYMVYVPRYVSLKIDNKFGDVYMDDFNGQLDISLSNGDMKANRLSGAPVVRLSSANGAINSISGGKVLASYSDLDIREATSLNMETKSSRITIDEVDNLTVDSKRDKYEIHQTDNLTIDSYFSNITVDNLNKELRSTARYGDLKVAHVSDRFSFMTMTSEYADIDLVFDRNTSYQLDITHHNDAFISLPTNLAKVETKVVNAEEKQMLTYGRVGNVGSDPARKVNIVAQRKCYITIVHR